MLTPPLFRLVRGRRRHAESAAVGCSATTAGTSSRRFRFRYSLLFAAASFKTQIHVNWTAPAFLSLTLGGAAIRTGRPRECGASAGETVAWGCVGDGCNLRAGTSCSDTRAWHGGSPGFSRTRRRVVGGRLAQRVDAERVRIDETKPARSRSCWGWKSTIAAEVGFYLHAPDECVNTYAPGAQGLGYRYWTDLGKFEGRPAVAVFPKPGEDLIKATSPAFRTRQ